MSISRSSLINHRLPTNVIPINYKIYIEPNLQKFIYKGFVLIQLDIINDTDRIVINSKNLSIKEKGVYLLNNKKIELTYDIDNDDETITIKTAKICTKGLYFLIIKYEGILNDKMRGFYRCKYNIDNEIKYLATTQFEPTDARQAFPCFDEPDFKSTFDIIICAPLDKTVLSNTEIVSIIKQRNKQIVTFKTTPKMSTYLVAFIVGDLEYIESKLNNTVIRAYCTPGKKNSIKYALNVTVKALDWFIKWFNSDYPLSKLDIVAIPEFSSGAMENWGLITFRESSMLCNENTSILDKQDITITICHELAHQWFGNLVTMKWWTYLWLNESMATYFGWLVTDKLFPQWKIWDRFLNEDYNTALYLDSLKSSHPIEVPIKNSESIQQIFDAISYSKGSCIIRYFVNYMGMDKFRNGMIKYMDIHKYKNTISDDLWSCFDDIKSIITKWITQTGYPVLYVGVKNGELTVTQQKFRKIRSHTKDETIWDVPIIINNSQTIILKEKSQKFKIETDDIYINSSRCGFYRVMYKKMPNYKILCDVDKNYLIDDTFILALSGYQNLDIPFKLLESISGELKTEKNFGVWGSVIRYINTIHKMMKYHSDIQESFKKKVMTKICKPLESLLDIFGWENIEGESTNDYNMRELILEQLVYMENQKVINEALLRFRNNNWKDRKNVILKTVGKFGDENDYIKLVKLLKIDDPFLVISVLDGLGYVRDRNFIDASIEIMMSKLVKKQDKLALIFSLFANQYSDNIIMDYVMKNWDIFVEMYQEGGSHLIALIRAIGSQLCTDQELEKYIEFTKDKRNGKEMPIDQTIEKIQYRINAVDIVKKWWNERND